MATLYFRHILEATAHRDGNDVIIKFFNRFDSEKYFTVKVIAGMAFAECSDGFEPKSYPVNHACISDMVGTIAGAIIETTTEDPTNWVLMVVDEYKHA